MRSWGELNSQKYSMKYFQITNCNLWLRWCVQCVRTDIKISLSQILCRKSYIFILSSFGNDLYILSLGSLFLFTFCWICLILTYTSYRMHRKSIYRRERRPYTRTCMNTWCAQCLFCYNSCFYDMCIGRRFFHHLLCLVRDVI